MNHRDGKMSDYKIKNCTYTIKNKDGQKVFKGEVMSDSIPYIVQKPNIEEIQKYIDYCEQMAENARSQVAEWNKDTEIQHLNKENKRLQAHSLVQLSDKELSSIRDFENLHYRKCKNGNTYWYRITDVGIGHCIEVKCDVCGEMLDVTDNTVW